MKRIKIYITVIFCALLFNCKTQNDESVVNVSPKELSELIKEHEGIKMIDVRTPEEFASGHISGAQNINFFDKNFAKSLEKLDKSEPVIIYCKSGRRSGKSRAVLKELGFEKIYDLEGGILNWKSQDFNVKLK